MCYGAQLQSPLTLKSNVLAVPSSFSYANSQKIEVFEYNVDITVSKRLTVGIERGEILTLIGLYQHWRTWYSTSTLMP